MKAHPLSISGSWKIEFQKFDDNRGFFYESFKEEDFKTQIGRNLNIKQTNTSSSSKGIELNENSATAIYIEEGLAHAFVALENQTVVTYFVTEKYNPEREKGINPFDKTLNVKWPDIELLLSEKDKQAISLEEAKSQGLLPTFDECKAFIKSLS